MKFADVAPVVSTPPHSAGSSKSSFSQSIATVSSRVASGEPTQLNAFWSSAVASQSAPRAAGVTPPVTKWKNRGPGEAVAAPYATLAEAKEAGAVTLNYGVFVNALVNDVHPEPEEQEGDFWGWLKALF